MLPSTLVATLLLCPSEQYIPSPALKNTCPLLFLPIHSLSQRELDERGTDVQARGAEAAAAAREASSLRIAVESARGREQSLQASLEQAQAARRKDAEMADAER